MILPTKRLNQDRSLLYIGAEVLRLLPEPKTVSRLWDDLKRSRVTASEGALVTYDWFVLVLAFLFALGGIELVRGRIRKVQP